MIKIQNKHPFWYINVKILIILHPFSYSPKSNVIHVIQTNLAHYDVFIDESKVSTLMWKCKVVYCTTIWSKNPLSHIETIRNTNIYCSCLAHRLFNTLVFQNLPQNPTFHLIKITTTHGTYFTYPSIFPTI